MQEQPDDELLTRLRRAEQAVTARDDFLAIAAHELRSPLNAISLRLAALEMLAERHGVQELKVEIERTRRSVDRYVRRAVVLLDVSRLNSPESHLSPGRVDVAELVRNVVEAHVDEAAFHGATLHAAVEGAPVGFWDPHMVEEILSNLVNNAIKYGDSTPVHVKAWADEAAGMARFEVSDRGPGIDAAARARIFEKFERLVAGSRDRAGFGLGLWIVGRMVAAHQGSINVTSPPEGGSRFLVSLPLRPAQARKKEESK
ncbi:sensor histidine kinase [Ramlibacter henchirensis]|nr:HAMP domain-containing sensor histidine kinase [Ramlibacter henchirensis]